MPGPLVEVADGIHVATSAVYATTSSVVVGGDGSCLLVDPSVTAREVAELSSAVRDRGWSPLAVWSTHDHWDHALDGPGLRDLPRWAAWVQRPSWVSAARADRDGDEELASYVRTHPGERGADLVDAPPAPPPLTDAAGPPGWVGVDWAGRRVLVLVHDAHAVGHSALHVPDVGALLAGDLLSDVEIPLLDTDATDPVGDYLATLDRIAALDDVRVVVPGHGAVGDAAELARRLAADRRYLERLVSEGATAQDPRLTTPWLVHAHHQQAAAIAR
ncbi:MBL fold metallo-hydrolase [Cellulomonas sp.]|uniref:MBL fold metallo-hydrolase n=1 Tax=Cellulomonas sp. TaxID=40001 RepID=UPI001B02CD40|nr:MBL fold metallo-hydrolase [Cellulomonas sp.]MBO9553974.1 MBL fold metallo-hydrolase [Cellulomonas sp.]